jgi:hypothetical protein
MKKLLLLLGVMLVLGVASQAQTVQCQAAAGQWGPCPFVQPVVVATVGGTAQINNKVSAAAGTTITNTFPGTTSAGNSILCVGFEGPAATPVFTDSQSNTYVVALSSGAAAPGYSVAIASNIVGGTTDTITLTTSSGSASFSCYELKGAISVGQVWDYVAVAQGTSASLVFPQESAAIANDFVVAAVGMGAGTINATPGLAGAPSNLSTVDQSNTAPLSGGSTPALSVFYSAHANVTNSPTFTQALSLSASETYSAVIVAIKPPSISLVGNVQDPCQQGAGTSGNISLTAGGTLITGATGKLTYICSMNLITATAQNIALVEGTGTVCATNTLGMAGGTTAATGWNFAANGGFVNGGGGFWVFKTATPGDNVCLLLSSTGQTSGSYRQVQQ